MSVSRKPLLVIIFLFMRHLSTLRNGQQSNLDAFYLLLKLLALKPQLYKRKVALLGIYATEAILDKGEVELTLILIQ